jgi:hypothetical protein
MVPADATAYSAENLPVSTTYYYRIAAYNRIGDSAYSNEATAIISDIAKRIIVVRNDECDENIRKAGGKNYKGEPLFDGNYDRIQNVLTALEIPHTLIGKSELDKDSYTLDDKRVLIFNCNFLSNHCCNPEHLKLPPRKSERSGGCPGDVNHIIHNTWLSNNCIKKIKEFVEAGGYLFTEDLNSDEIIGRAFRGIISHTRLLPEKAVKIMPAPGSESHPFLKNVFKLTPYNDDVTTSPEINKTDETPVNLQWKIDDESANIKILNKDKVKALIVSPELAEKDTSAGVVAVTFDVPDPTGHSPGGKVLHIMTHFGRQGSIVDERALQKLLMNFIISAIPK